ncbi:MAG: metallophosphoesterase [Pseudomonadota bacterium]
MAAERELFTIAQFSDIHCGDSRFEPALMEALIDEVNLMQPDLVVAAGDLTSDGYREQFEEARHYLDQIESDRKLVIAGNHDCRNVGYLHFEEIFGPRHYRTEEFDFGLPVAAEGGRIQEKIRILALDSNKPDLNDGEIGSDYYGWIDSEYPNPEDFKLFLLHHHLVGIPGTGRERNVVLDAGDVLERLKVIAVDLVLCGHRHVPYNWPVANFIIVSSGTASTFRTRGYTQPSYNIVEIDPEVISVTTKVPGGIIAGKERFRRHASPLISDS